jgi:putative peptidoglycan lipid II flippase
VAESRQPPTDNSEPELSYRAVPSANSAARPAARRFGGYAALVAAGILLSRVAGLIRNRVFAHYLGSSGAADAFNAALKTPNFLQNMFGEGVLSASFIPVYARLVAKDDEKLAGRVAGVIASFFALGISIIVLFGVLLAPFILRITFPGFEPPVMELAVKLVRIIFPGVGLLVLYAWAIGILNTHKQFFLSYVAPVLWNAAMIATLVIFGSRLADADLAVALAWGTLIGCALQFGIQVPFVLKYQKQLSFGFDRSLPQVRDVFRNIAPVMGGRGVVQISGYIDTMIASLLPTGVVTNIFYAQTIYMLPISVFGMSVAAAELPQMSSEKGSEEEVRLALRKRLDRGLRQVSFFVIPTTVAFFVIGHLIVAALYQTGDFTTSHTLLVWYILIGSTIGLLAATLARLYSSTLYAMQDTKTPFRIAVIRIVIGAALGFLFAFPLRPMLIRLVVASGLPIPALNGGPLVLGAIGITAASGVAAIVEYLLLRNAIRNRIGRGESKVDFYLKLWTAAIAAGLAADIFDVFAGRAIASRLPLRHIVEAIGACGIFGLVYFGIGYALGVPEVRATIGRIIKR